MKEYHTANLNSISARASRLRRGEYRIASYHDKPQVGVPGPQTSATRSSGRFERRTDSGSSYSSGNLRPPGGATSPTQDQKWHQAAKSPCRFEQPHSLQHASSFRTSSAYEQTRPTSYTNLVGHATRRTIPQRAADRTGHLIPPSKSKKDDMEKETTRTQNSTGPIRCTLDLSGENLNTMPLPHRDMAHAPKVNSANSDHESELLSRSGGASQWQLEEKDSSSQRHSLYPWFPRDARTPTKEFKSCEDETMHGQARYQDKDRLGSDLPKGKKVNKDVVSDVTVRKSDYIAIQELSEMFSLLDQFLNRASGFVEKAVPQAQFPDVMKPIANGSNRKKYADLLGRLNVMEKLFDFAEHKMSDTQRSKVEVATQTERTLISEKQAQVGPFQDPQLRQPEVRRSFSNQNVPSGFVEKPRAATRSYSAPRPWGTGFPLQGLRSGSLTCNGLLPHQPANVWAQYGTLSALSTMRQQPVSAEQKIRDWLGTIPIGNSKSRGWDDEQIKEIAEFAERTQLGYLSAEEIYSKYVEFQVEEANKE